MSKEKHKLIIVAHPDDESLFFSGLMLVNTNIPWHVVCVTDGNANSRGSERLKQFQKACLKLGAHKIHLLRMPDKYNQRLDIQTLTQHLQQIPEPTEVYTHGPLGEYGHPHHQDISYATHIYFNKKCEVWSPAYNCKAEKVIQLSSQLYLKKCRILSGIYLSETKKFIHFIPSSSIEGYTQFTAKEVSQIYKFLTDKKSSLPRLEKLQWYRSYLLDFKNKILKRPF